MRKINDKGIILIILAIMLISSNSIATASPLLVTAVSAKGEAFPNTKIFVQISTSSNPMVWNKSGVTNTGQYTFEVPAQYTGPGYFLKVIASSGKKHYASYSGIFKNTVNLII